jgi:thioesterase III
MEKVLKSQHKIRFQDCDPFNHLNNSKYIDYFINAREDQLIDHYQIDVFDLTNKTGLSWVVASNQIIYKRPAITMETVIIESQLIKYSSKNLLVEMRMWDIAQTKLKALAWINFVHYDIVKKRAADHSDQFMQLFETVHLGIDTDVFEQRITSI